MHFLGKIIFSERNWQKRNHPNKRANLARESSKEILLEFILVKCYGSLRLPRISLLNLRRKKKRNRGFFGGILMDVKGDKNSVAKIPCLKNCWISEVWRSFGSGCFQLHRGANQKMSFTPVPSIARPTDRRRICINWTLRWRFFQQGGGGDLFFFKKADVFLDVF